MAGLSENITIIENVSKEDLKALIPSFRYDWLQLLGSSINKIHCFAMKNESDKIIAVCVYISRFTLKKTATLLYIQVLEKYRNQKNATNLFFESLEQLKKWGYVAIEAFAIDDSDHQILKKWDLSSNKRECFMIYNLDILLSSKIGKSLEKLAPIRKHVKRFSDLSPAEITDFNKILLNNGHHNDIDKCDPNLTRYYMGNNGNIMGFLPLTTGDDGNSYMNTDLYIPKNENANIALPAMLADFLISGKNKINKDTRLIMHVASKTNYNTMIQGFGNPTKEILADVYYYSISTSASR